MFKLNGTEYSLKEVTSAAESSNLSVDEYVKEFGPETVEVTDEIQTPVTEGKTNGAAEVDAAVAPVATPSRASMIVDAPLENTESDSVNTSGELQPKKVGRPNAQTRAAQRAATVEQQVDNNETTEPESTCLLYTSPSPRDRTRSRMPSSA